MVDGAIGMAYGVISTTILMSFGVPPATASASVHAAEVFTTAASGTAHWRMGNVDRKLVARLAMPGMLGGGVGAYILATVPGDSIRPIVSAYLLVMGVVILWRAIWKVRGEHEPPKHVGVLGLMSGFLDAIGGGGWGAMVTSTLIGRGLPATICHRFSQCGRVLCHGNNYGDIVSDRRPIPLACHHGPCHRWCPRGPVCRLHDQALATPNR